MNENCFEGKMSRKKKSTPDKDSILRNETLGARVCVCVCVCVWKCVCGCVTGWNPANAFHFIGSEHRCRRRRRKDGWKRVEEERKREFDYCWKPIIIFFDKSNQTKCCLKAKLKKKRNSITFSLSQMVFDCCGHTNEPRRLAIANYYHFVFQKLDYEQKKIWIMLCWNLSHRHPIPSYKREREIEKKKRDTHIKNSKQSERKLSEICWTVYEIGTILNFKEVKIIIISNNNHNNN